MASHQDEEELTNMATFERRSSDLCASGRVVSTAARSALALPTLRGPRHAEPDTYASQRFNIKLLMRWLYVQSTVNQRTPSWQLQSSPSQDFGLNKGTVITLSHCATRERCVPKLSLNWCERRAQHELH